MEDGENEGGKCLSDDGGMTTTRHPDDNQSTTRRLQNGNHFPPKDSIGEYSIVKASRAEAPAAAADADALLNQLHSFSKLDELQISFCRDFIKWIEKAETEIDVFGYLNFVHAKTAKKNPKSFLRLFITLAMKSDVLNEYLSANPKVKSIKYINCPACGSLILENKTCEYCELEVAQRNNPDDVRFHAGWHNLTESEKAEYNETMQQIVAMPILLQNERDIAELKLKQKFNLCD